MNYYKQWRISISRGKTQYIVFHKKNVRNKARLNIHIDGQTLAPTTQVEFLGVILDKNLTLRHHHQKIMKELKGRVKIFSGITGSNFKPRVDSQTSLKILRSMIIPVTTYAPCITALRDDAKFAKQNIEIRKATRMALHAPPSTLNAYLENCTGLSSCKDRALKLASNYVSNDKRSPQIRNLYSLRHDPVRAPLLSKCCNL